jgi:hypothetical protein
VTSETEAPHAETDPLPMARKATLIQAVARAFAWALLMAASAALSISWLDWQNPNGMRAVALLFFLGGIAAFPIALLVARMVVPRARRETIFAANLLSLAGSTVGITALLFALHYRHYYAHWHEPPFTIGWTFQYIFTVLAALYHFAVLGVRLYLPFGVPALFAFSLWRAVRSR